jgi:uncharacterized protein with beta-barrel porin domain
MGAFEGTGIWQHNLSNTRSEDHLAFANGNTAFSVQNVSLDRNAAVWVRGPVWRWRRTFV